MPAAVDREEQVGQQQQQQQQQVVVEEEVVEEVVQEVVVEEEEVQEEEGWKRRGRWWSRWRSRSSRRSSRSRSSERGRSRRRGEGEEEGSCYGRESTLHFHSLSLCCQCSSVPQNRGRSEQVAQRWSWSCRVGAGQRPCNALPPHLSFPPFRCCSSPHASTWALSGLARRSR